MLQSRRFALMTVNQLASAHNHLRPNGYILMKRRVMDLALFLAHCLKEQLEAFALIAFFYKGTSPA